MGIGVGWLKGSRARIAAIWSKLSLTNCLGEVYPKIMPRVDDIPSEEQLVVARKVMERREKALRQLSQLKTAEAIMREDRAILSHLAKD